MIQAQRAPANPGSDDTRGREATSCPSLAVNSCGMGRLGVSVGELGADMMHSLARHLEAGGRLEGMLRVTVAQAEAPVADAVPDILGRCELLEDGIRFVPMFPFEPGLPYRATFDAGPLTPSRGPTLLTLEFSLPRVHRAGTTTVEHIFPSGDCLPENLLRFYVCFSHPMQRGYAEREISLLGPDGAPAADVLYRAPVELWDRAMRVLTVLLDPGRLKRGVGPNRALGAPLKPGQAYTLAVGAGMTDLSGRPLGEPVYKRFKVADAVREAIQVQQWRVIPPASGSHAPLVLVFPASLDWAMLRNTITIRSSSGESMPGRILVDQAETRWGFTPDAPWTRGAYRVDIDAILEDPAGNTLLAAFDRPARVGCELSYERAIHSIPFDVTPPD